MKFGQFIEDDNITSYLDFLFRYTIPMTRRSIIEEALKDNRKGRLAGVPNVLDYLTPSDHAFALLSMVNHYDDWSGKLDAFINRDKKAMKKIKTKWTQASARNSINTGWQPDAIAAFEKCESYFTKFSATAEWDALVHECGVRMEAKLRDDIDERLNRKEVTQCSGSDLGKADPVALELDDEMWGAFVNNGCTDVECNGDYGMQMDKLDYDIDDDGVEGTETGVVEQV